MSVEGTLLQNTMTDLALGVKMHTLANQSQLSNYGTISHTNNYALLTLNRTVLTYLYVGNGIFQTVIDLPVQDAFSQGVELESDEIDANDIEEVLSFMESPSIGAYGSNGQTPWEALQNSYKWNRVFGGSGVFINDGEDPETPFNINNIKQGQDISFHDIDRWQIDNESYQSNIITEDAFNQEFLHINGLKIHNSRVLRLRGKRAPYYVRQQLRGWGMSEAERMIRDLNLYFKTKDVLYEIIDESKVDVYKIDGLSNKLMQRGGTDVITKRVTLANEIKSYVNALVLDAKEDFEQKSMTFTGLADVMAENRIGVASTVRFPITKLFGISASGFNTGESDLETYNAMVESDVRTPARPIIKIMLDIAMMRTFGRIPSYTFSFPSLRVLSSVDEETIKASQSNRALAMFDRGIINTEEFADIGKKEKWLEVPTRSAEGRNLNPVPPNDGGFITEPVTQELVK